MLRCALVSRMRMGRVREVGERGRLKKPPVLAQQPAAVECERRTKGSAHRRAARLQVERTGLDDAATPNLRLERGIAEGDAVEAEFDGQPDRVVVHQVEVEQAGAFILLHEAGERDVAAIAGPAESDDALWPAVAASEVHLEILAQLL